MLLILLGLPEVYFKGFLTITKDVALVEKLNALLSLLDVLIANIAYLEVDVTLTLFIELQEIFQFQ